MPGFITLSNLHSSHLTLLVMALYHFADSEYAKAESISNHIKELAYHFNELMDKVRAVDAAKLKEIEASEHKEPDPELTKKAEVPLQSVS